MDTIKFIHTADLHLDSPFKGLNHLPAPIFEKLTESTFSAFHSVIELAIQEHVDFILIAGDLFDDKIRSLKAQISLRKGFEKLAKADIYVYVIHGNHDHLGGSWAQISWPENVHFFSKDVEVHPFIKNGKTLAHIYGFSYPKRAVTENMVKYFNKTEGALYHIAMLHGNLEGKEDHDPYAPFTVQQLLEKNFDYWALGHIHKQQILHEHPYIIYPGNIQGRHRKETGEKGCFIVEARKDGMKPRFVSCSSIIWETILIAIDELVTVDELLIVINKNKQSFRSRYDGTILTIHLTGRSSLYEQLNDGQFLNELSEIVNEGEELEDSFVWVAAIHNDTILPYDRGLFKADTSFIGDLLKQIDDYNDEAFEDSLKVVLSNHKANFFLQNFKEDKQEIIRQAERLLLHELLKE